VGVRGLAIAILVLAAIVATPALSAAQDAGTTEAPPPSSIPAPPEQVPPPAEAGAPPPDQGTPSAEQAKADEADQASATPAPPAAATYAAGGGAARAATSKSVSIGDNFYTPTSVTVSVGDSVTWANNGQAQHSATANDGSFDTGVFGPGNSRSQTFNRAGTFSYFCTVHGQSQSGTVRVLAASSGGGGGGGGGGGSAGASGSDSEAAAVASPDAAGTSTSLAATGLEGLVLAALGLALLGGGVALRRRIAPR
jgi:plastocyanin